MIMKKNKNIDKTPVSGDESRLPITAKGFWFVVAGIVLMLVGYLLLSGGGVKDPEVFNYDMFNFRRLVMAPVVIVAGLVVIVVGIMGNFNKKEN